MSLFVTHAQLYQVIRKDHEGRTIRISNYVKTAQDEKPVSEQIYYPDGRSMLYLYNESGDKIEQMAKIEKVEEPPKGF